MKPPFTYSVQSRSASGHSYVSDGSMILRADLVTPIASPTGVRDITPEQTDAILQATPAAMTSLADLVPSRIAPAVHRTPDDVAISERYVQLLRSLELPLTCGTTGLRGPVVLRHDREIVGAVMPVALIPEFGHYLPTPALGRRRGRIARFSTEQAHGAMGFDDASSASFTVEALRGVAPVELVVGGLVDCRLERSPAGELRVVEIWPAGAPAPAAPAPPPAPSPGVAPLRWPTRAAFDGLLRNGLLGWCDGGTFARMIVSVLGRFPDPESLDSQDVLRLLLSAYGGREAKGYSADPSALRDGIFLIDPTKPLTLATLQEGVAAFARHHGLAAPLDPSEPPDIVSVFDALGRAFAAAGRPERVFLVGGRAPFVVVRREVVPVGSFMRVEPWTLHEEPAEVSPPTDPTLFIRALGERLQTEGCTVIRQVSSLRVDAHGAAPGHTVHVLQRSYGDRPESFFVIATSGFSTKPLTATGPRFLERFELVTFSARHDEMLLKAISTVGRAVHAIADAEGGAPIALGHSVAFDAAPLLGWRAVLLAHMTAPIDVPWGRVDAARMLPLTEAERVALRGRQDPLFGSGFVLEVENRDFGRMLGRWYEHLS